MTSAPNPFPLGWSLSFDYNPPEVCWQQELHSLIFQERCEHSRRIAVFLRNPEALELLMATLQGVGAGAPALANVVDRTNRRLAELRSLRAEQREVLWEQLREQY